MCISNPQTVEIKEMVGWQVVRKTKYFKDSYDSLWAIRRKTVSVWIDRKHNPSEEATPLNYPSGFHFFKTRESARLLKTKLMDKRLRVVKIQARNIFLVGNFAFSDLRRQTYVAKKMRILGESR